MNNHRYYSSVIEVDKNGEYIVGFYYSTKPYAKKVDAVADVERFCKNMDVKILDMDSELGDGRTEDMDTNKKELKPNEKEASKA